MAIERILIVDDEPLLRNFLRDTLKRMDKHLTIATNGQEAIDFLSKEPFDLVITDMKMPMKNGIDVLKFAKKMDPHILVVIMTAYGNFETAVEAMQNGAFNYLIKPFSPDAIEALLDKGEEHLALVLENSYLREQADTASDSKLSNMIAQSPAMKQIISDMGQIAESQASVFISGESGTGKEVVASAIHSKSLRNKAPFIKVNCAAVPETLIESEFFGHEKGAFTGAAAKHIGKFEMANKGTLLLDEVTEIPLALQPKLLRAIQEQEIERIGGNHPIKVNIRFIATSNRNMVQAIEDKVFREDLYYRLNVIPIHLEPLRNRKEDIVPLANFFLKKFCSENHKMLKKLTQSAAQKLRQYPWPGNVRELANIIERTVVLHTSQEIDEPDLRLDPTIEKPSAFETGTEKDLPENISLHELEKRYILQTLRAHNENRTRTAKVLGISVRTLRNKIHEYNCK